MLGLIGNALGELLVGWRDLEAGWGALTNHLGADIREKQHSVRELLCDREVRKT